MRFLIIYNDIIQLKYIGLSLLFYFYGMKIIFLGYQSVELVLFLSTLVVDLPLLISI